MMEACRAAGVPVPGLRYEPSGLWVEFSYPAIPMDSGAAETGGSGGVATQETPQKKILALLRAQPAITRRELTARIGISPDGIKYHLNKMKSTEAIRHVGPTKTGYWEVLKGKPTP